MWPVDSLWHICWEARSEDEKLSRIFQARVDVGQLSLLGCHRRREREPFVVGGIGDGGETSGANQVVLVGEVSIRHCKKQWRLGMLLRTFNEQ